MQKGWRHLFLNQSLLAFKPKREDFPRILRPWEPDVVDVLINEPFHFNNTICLPRSLSFSQYAIAGLSSVVNFSQRARR